MRPARRLPVTRILLVAAPQGLVACASILGIRTITDDDGAFDGSFGDELGFSSDGGVHDGPDAGAVHEAAAPPTCDANLVESPNNCGACGHVCGTINSMTTCAGGTCVFACNAGYTHCGDDSTGCAASLAVDVHNCGACGHDCLGTGCTGGLCAVTNLETSRNAPFSVAVDGTSVYWSEQGSSTAMPTAYGDGAIAKAPVDGGVASVVAPAQGGPRDLTLDGTQLYWANRIAGEIRSGQTTAVGSTLLVAGQDRPWIVIADGTTLFWGNAAGDAPIQPAGSVWTSSTDGGGARALAQAQYSPIALALAQGALYWVVDTVAPDGGLTRLPLDGGPAQFLAPTYNPVSITTNGQNLVWTQSAPIDAGAIFAATLGGASPKAIVGQLYNPGYGLAADTEHVYWTDYTAGSVWRVNVDGSGLLLLARGRAYPGGLAIDDSYVYWADEGSVSVTTGWFDNHDGIIARVPK